MNKSIFMGNLTKDFTANEAVTVARSGMALNRGKDKDGNDRGTDYINLVAFTGLQSLCQYGKKGRRFLIEAHVQTGSYEKNGQKVYTTDFVVDRWEFADSKTAENSGAANDTGATEGEFMKIPADIDEELPFN